MGKIIAVANQKGGVGKTTTAVNIAASLGNLGKKVLIVDIDPQGNATSGMGISKREIRVSSYEVLIGTADAAEALCTAKSPGVTVLPAHISLAGAEIELVDMERREQRLKMGLLPLRQNYDYIIIDCPPSLGLLTLNALVAADSLLIPIQCEYYALEGLSQLIATVRQVKRLYNDRIEIEGVLLTMYNARLNLTAQVVHEIKKYFSDKLFATAIPRNVRLSEAPSYGEPALYYDRASGGAQAYLAVAQEILKRNEVR